MDVKDSISVTLKTIDGKETKDQSAKNIFSYKPIMSNILKYTVEEYRDCSLEEIMNCIEGDTIQRIWQKPYVERIQNFIRQMKHQQHLIFCSVL